VLQFFPPNTLILCDCSLYFKNLKCKIWKFTKLAVIRLLTSWLLSLPEELRPELDVTIPPSRCTPLLGNISYIFVMPPPLLSSSCTTYFCNPQPAPFPELQQRNLHANIQHSDSWHLAVQWRITPTLNISSWTPPMHLCAGATQQCCCGVCKVPCSFLGSVVGCRPWGY
jgi:hypothetical protein